MPEPISLCVENVEGIDEDARFIRCVALEGNRPGLGIDERGRPLWLETQGCACELWVSSDDKLIVLRPVGAAPSRVHRAGRSVDVPENRPVVVLDQDEIEVAGTRLRLHVHGPTSEIHEPTPFTPPARASVAALAAAVVIGVAAGGCDRSTSETDTAATAIAADTLAATATASTADAAGGSTASSGESPTATATGQAEPTAHATVAATVTAVPTATPTARPTATPPIEVRPRPPAPPRRDPPKGGDALF